jgi:hypothetical protein
MLSLTTAYVQQYAAVLTRYPLFQPLDPEEEWDNEFYQSRCMIPSPPLPLPLGPQDFASASSCSTTVTNVLVAYEKRIISKKRPVGKDGKVEYFAPTDIALPPAKPQLRRKTDLVKVKGIK